MAITDNAFTAAEVQAAVTANPALLTELKTGLTPLGHYAIPKEEYEGFISNERNVLEGSVRSEVYKTIDKDVFDTTGIAKASADEKTYDYVKRTLGQYKTLEESLKGEVTTLKKQISEGSTDVTLKTQLEQAQKDLKDFQDNKLPGFEKQLFSKDVSLQFHLALQKLDIKKDLPAVLLQPALDKAEADLLAIAKKDTNGQLYFADAEGKAILNGAKVADAEFMLRSTLKDILAVGAAAAGAGTGAPGAGGTGTGAATGVKNADGNDIVVPVEVKSKAQLHEFLGKQGLTAESKEFNDLFEKYGKDLPLRPPTS